MQWRQGKSGQGHPQTGEQVIYGPSYFSFRHPMSLIRASPSQKTGLKNLDIVAPIIDKCARDALSIKAILFMFYPHIS
jgi:hypothetical protein